MGGLKMAKKLRVAVIGAGIGRYHAMGYMAHPMSEVVAVCDPDIERGANMIVGILGKTTIPTIRSHKEMLHLVDVDAVSVYVPNAFHMPVVLDCLAAGKHVLCEKPLARNAKEGQQMVDAAAKAGKLLMTQFNNRYRPEATVLKQYITDGALGDIYLARAGWVRRNGIPGWGGWFTQKESAGGGPIIDLGVHMLDLTMWLMGNPEPEIVLASAYSVFGPKMEALGPGGTPNTTGQFDVEDMGCALIKFHGGQTIMLEAGWAARLKREHVYSTLMGTQAGASLERVFTTDGVDDTSVDTLEIFGQENGVPVNRSLVVEPDPYMGRLAAVGHFVDCLTNGAECMSSGADGLRIMRILDAIYKSAEKGKAVNIK